MSEEKKELKKEDLENVSGGKPGNDNNGKDGLWSNFRVTEDDKVPNGQIEPQTNNSK